MKLLPTVPFLLCLSLSGCFDLPPRWEKPAEDRIAALTGQCRSYGFIPGSPQHIRCMTTKEHDDTEHEIAEREAIVEAKRSAGTSYSKEAAENVPRPIWMDCKTFPEGQSSCVGR